MALLISVLFILMLENDYHIFNKNIRFNIYKHKFHFNLGIYLNF